MKYRFENFGGIISCDNPPCLVYVDRNYMKELGLDGSVSWNTEDESVGLLSAPTEVHFAITNKCSAGCPHCYMGAGAPDTNELDTESMKKALDILSEMKVFHVAMGGGEALEREDLFEVADYARSVGLVPNLTISGMGVTKEIAEKLRVFGQVNISIDGLDEDYAVYRGKNNFMAVDHAFDILKAAGIAVGINCVVGKDNFLLLESIFRYAQGKHIREIEFLRFKPSGRAKEHYFLHRTTHQQNIQLIPDLLSFSAKYNIEAKIDCSFVPMMCYHKPSPELLQAMAAYGCEAGNVLLGIRSNGEVSGCSFLENSGLSVFELSPLHKNYRNYTPDTMNWMKNPFEPCKSCDYIGICKGGCHGVSRFVDGDFNLPDPECPVVYAYRQQRK